MLRYVCVYIYTQYIKLHGGSQAASNYIFALQKSPPKKTLRPDPRKAMLKDARQVLVEPDSQVKQVICFFFTGL